MNKNRIVSMAAALAAVSLTACGGTASGVVTDASVALDDSGNRVVSWTSTAPVTVSVSTSPSEPGEVVARDVEDASFVFETADNRRVYFTLQPENGAAVTTALRVLPLEGGRNFRDLGGYETEDGRTVRWGTVFRSGVMHSLTDADYDYLAGLGVKVVCDFRAIEERSSEPTDWRAGDIDYVAWDYTSADSGEQLAAVFRDPGVTPEAVSDTMAQFYGDMVYEHATKFEAMFDRLARGQLPLTFNCSAGKDRTGVAAALLLTALGVPRETVVEDYAMSEKVVDYMAVFASPERQTEESDEENPYAFLAQMPPELVLPLLRSDPKYLESAFAQLEKDHGSVMNFIQTELGVDDDELESMRDALLN